MNDLIEKALNIIEASAPKIPAEYDENKPYIPKDSKESLRIRRVSPVFDRNNNNSASRSEEWIKNQLNEWIEVFNDSEGEGRAEMGSKREANDTEVGGEFCHVYEVDIDDQYFFEIAVVPW